MRHTHFSLTLQLFRVRFFDAFKEEKLKHTAKSEDDTDEEPEPHFIYANNLLHSLLSNCDFYFNKTLAYRANGFYPHIAEISNKIKSSAVSNKGTLACHRYNFKRIWKAFDMHPFSDRASSIGNVVIFFSLWEACY